MSTQTVGHNAMHSFIDNLVNAVDQKHIIEVCMCHELCAKDVMADVTCGNCTIYAGNIETRR